MAHSGSGAVFSRLGLKTAAVSYPRFSKLALLICTTFKYFSLSIFVSQEARPTSSVLCGRHLVISTKLSITICRYSLFVCNWLQFALFNVIVLRPECNTGTLFDRINRVFFSGSPFLVCLLGDHIGCLYSAAFSLFALKHKVITAVHVGNSI